MDILITGGAGYIGSHTAIELLNNKRNIIIILLLWIIFQIVKKKF